MATSNIAPAPQFPEKEGNVFERQFAASRPGNRGPMRFQEGVATDTDVPMEFSNGVSQGTGYAPGRPNHNLNVFEKWPEETMKERAHLGSAAWVESPQFLQDFSGGAFQDYGTATIEQVARSGGHYSRMNPAVVND